MGHCCSHEDDEGSHHSDEDVHEDVHHSSHHSSHH